jgi:molybdopterin/thiamine biosynthesis adenylyltransferase
MNRIEFSDLSEGRYDRHQLISWWDQKMLSQSQFIVAGAGALGNEVLKLLALIGVGRITVVDFDTISRSNLARMVLFREADVGRPKVEVAIERLKEINPEVEVTGVHGDLRFDIGLGDYRSADIVFGCLDSVNARWALNRKCMLAGVDWVDGGISDHHGMVAHYSPGGGACYECNFTAATIERFNRRYSCPFGLASDLAENKVPTTALTTSMVAAIQVQQALLRLHSIEDESLSPGERLLVYLKPFRMIKDRLPYNPECEAHITVPSNIPVLEGSNDLTIEQVFGFAQERFPNVSALSLDYDLVTSFYCSTCDTEIEINRPKEKVMQNESRCQGCGQMREPRFVNKIEPGSPAGALRLMDIGIPPRDILAFNSGEMIEYIQLCE